MKKNQSLFKRVLISGERGKYKACQICQKKFGKEHQCKRCKRAVCEKCSNHKGRVFTESGQEEKALHRQCNICKEESDSIKKFVDTNHIQFLQDTKALEWLSQFGVTKEQAKTEYLQAQSKISQSEQSEIRKLKNNLNIAFAEIPGVFNYSLREFIYHVLKDNEYETLKQVTGRVLETFLSNYNEVGFSPDLIMLTVFFLCFGSESAAFSLLNIFFAEMVQANLYPANIMQYDNGEDIDRVLLVLNSSFKMQSQDKPLITNFLKSRLIKYQQCFTINMLQFESTYYIIDSLYSLHQQAQEEFIKFIASALSQNIADVKANQLNIEEIEVILLRQVKYSMIQEGYFKTKSVQFSPYTKTMSRSQITSRFSSVIQDQTSSNMDFDRVSILNKIVENQKQEIAKLNQQLNGTESVRKKTVQLKQKDQTNLQNDLKQVEDEDLVFSNLRRKTLHLLNQEEADEDVAVLTDYINKLEEVLILKHRVVKDQNIKILEMQEKNEKLFEEIKKLKKDVQLSEGKFIDQTKITHQIEKEMNEKSRIIDEYKKKNKELQDNLVSQQTENNKYKIQLLEAKALEGGQASGDGLKSNSYLREMQKLQDENAKLLKKISDLENQVLEQNSKSSDQNETRKLQIQITQLEQQKFLINAQLSQRESTITQLQRQIQGLLEESSMKSEGDQFIQERKKNGELSLQISNYQNQEKVWKSKLSDIEHKLKEQVLINQELKTKVNSQNPIITITKDENERSYERIREQLQFELEAKTTLTKQLFQQIEELSIKLNQERTKSQNLQIDYDQLIEQTNFRQNRSQTIQQQNQQKDQRIQDFSAQIEQLQLELSKSKSQLTQLSTMHQNLQDNFRAAEMKIVELEHQKRMYDRTIQEKVELITSYETKIKELNTQKNQLDDQLTESLKKQSEYRSQLDSLQFQVGNKGREYESLKQKIEEQELIILGQKEKIHKVKESNEAEQNEKSILGTEQENLKRQLQMKEEQIRSRQEQVSSLNEQIRNLNEKVYNLEQQRTLSLKQVKHLEDQLNSREREYMTEISKVISERDLQKQRVIEAEAQILKLQQNDKKLRNEISNLNEELQQQLLTLEQVNKQIKDYEIQQNQSRESNLENNKVQQLKWDRLEQQNQNMNIKIEAQNQEIKSYTAKIEEQLTTITELKYKVQEEESLRRAKEKQANDKVQQISQLENQLIKIQEKYNQSNRLSQDLQNQYDDLKKRYDVELNSMQSLQSKSIEYSSLQQRYMEQSQKLSSLEKQLLDYNEIQDQHQKQKKELQSLTDLLDQKLATIVSYETKIIDLTNQLKESNSQLQQVRKENHEIMQKRAQDMQAMAQLKQIEVENGELKQQVYSHEATIQNQEALLSVLKGNQLNLEQNLMKLRIDYQHLEEKYNEKMIDFDEKSKALFNLQNKFDSINFRAQQNEENLRLVEDQRDDYQSRYELALQELDIYKGKDKEINLMATNKIELQEQMHQVQKKNKVLERELQVSQNALQSKESDILQLQHTIQKKEQQITTLEGAIVKLKADLNNSKNSYEQLQLELTEMNSEQTSSGELFSQVKKLTNDNLNKNTQIDQLKLQINELQDKNRNLEKQYNKLRSDALVGNSINSDSFELKSRLDELEGQFKQSQFIIKQKEQQIQELKQLLDNQKQQPYYKEKEKQQNNKQKNVSNDHENMKIQEYQFIIEQQTEEIENMKKNSHGLGEELTELLTQIVSVFLKKKIKKDQLNIATVLDQIKLFQKENKSLTIREEDDEQLIIQKLQQYRGDYINFRFRIEQILTRITVLKQQMLQVIQEAKIQGKKKDIDKNMDVENLVMYFKLLLDSQAVQYSNQRQLCQQYEAELKSYQNSTSPQGQVIQQVKELLSKAPFLTQQQIYQFTEPKVSIKLRKDQDQEDARLLLEARNQQIQWLKNLIKEKQDQLAMMNTYLTNLKQLMDKYHLK
ncbi:unnamed protein product [Paramecium primaurelia]|uniref:FYVE-type domain-containing protein n=1 Tax=Paramecium primaurelia TaxID=5886 RepID=A0A8S1JPZ0_PARPR|nr:unnamed protein product [Paramecium primaurelia]